MLDDQSTAPTNREELHTGFEVSPEEQALLAQPTNERLVKIIDKVITMSKAPHRTGARAIFEEDISHLSDEDRYIFSRTLIIKFLDEALKIFDNLRAYSDLETAAFKEAILNEEISKYKEISNLLRTLQLISEASDDAGILYTIIGNISHDYGRISVLVNIMGVIIAQPSKIEFKDILRNAMANAFKLNSQIMRANQSIIRGEIAIKKFNFKDAIAPALAGLKRKYPDAEVVLDIPEELELYGNPEAVSVAIFNLLKNSARHKKANMPTSINLSINELNGKCLKITIEDNGTGIDYEKLAETLKNSGQTFQVEPDAMDHRQLTSQLFRRGISLNGTDGIGLSLVKTIVDLHDGTITIENINEPESKEISGVRVTILLPNINSDNRTERVSAVSKTDIMGVLT